jgi:hypothetical protein
VTKRHFFRNACTMSGSLRFSQFSGCWLILSVYILSLWKIVRSSVILLLPLWLYMCVHFNSLSLYIFTIWKCIAYNFFCRDGIYFDKILVSEYKLFKRSNKATLYDVKIFLTFTSPNMVLLWQMFYLFCSCI